MLKLILDVPANADKLLPTAKDKDVGLGTPHCWVFNTGTKVHAEDVIFTTANYVVFCLPQHPSTQQFGCYFVINCKTGAVESQTFILTQAIEHAVDLDNSLIAMYESMQDSDVNATTAAEIMDEIKH